MRWSVLLTVAACGSPHEVPIVPHEAPMAETKLPDGPPLAMTGESMSYRLTLGDMDLATYDLAVSPARDHYGRHVIEIQSHAKAVGLVKLVTNIDDYFGSWIDVTTGRPLLWQVDEITVKGSDRERTDAHLAERSGNTVPIFFHLNDEPPKPEPQIVSLPDVWDYNSFLIALRRWDAPVGSTVSAEVLRSRYLWHVDLRVHGKEKLVTALGPFPALRIDGHTYKLGRDGKRLPDSDERDFSLWISDDADRVPLQNTARTDYGDVKLMIVDYIPGGRSVPNGR